MQPIVSLDHAVVFFFANHHLPWLDTLILTITKLGNWYVLVPASVLFTMLLAQRDRRMARVFILTAMATALLCYVTQISVGRPRPDVAYELQEKPSVPSFPSGHAMNSLVIYGLFALLWTSPMPTRPRLLWRGLALLVVVLIGFTRMYIPVHYLSDVLGGWLGGTAMIVLALSFIEAPAARQ